MTDDPIQTAFASLRADEAPRLAAPGVAAARRTVRHRRRLAAGAAAGLTTVLLLGAGYLATAAGDPDPAPVAADGAEPTPPPEEPEGAGDGMGELSAAVSAALGLDGTSLGVVLEVAASETTLDPAAEFGIADTDIDPGTFRMQVACGGAGTVTVTLRTSNDEEATAAARCGTTTEEIADGVGETTVTFADEEEFVEVSLERDQAASEADSAVAIDFVPA